MSGFVVFECRCEAHCSMRAQCVLNAARTQTFESIHVLFTRLYRRQFTSAMANIVSKTHCARNQVEARRVKKNLA
jgi:hypothetical protein